MLARSGDVLACYMINRRYRLRLLCQYDGCDGFGLVGISAPALQALFYVRLSDVLLMTRWISQTRVFDQRFTLTTCDPRVTAPDTANSALMFDPKQAAGCLLRYQRPRRHFG
jgi:hypothetical protein